MKANDLRCLNLVYWITNGVKSIREVDPSDIEDCNSYPKQYEGIPITEDWLDKFGFDKNGLFQTEFFEMDWDEGILKVSVGDYCTSGIATRIEYVHQIQNLYYSLHLEEIKIS